MNVLVRLTQTELDNVRQAAIQNKTTINGIVQDTVSAVFSGKVAYIILDPAPPAEVVEEVREAVNKVINKGRSYLYVPNHKM